MLLGRGAGAANLLQNGDFIEESFEAPVGAGGVKLWARVDKTEAIDFELTVALDEGMGEVCGRQDSLRVSPQDSDSVTVSIGTPGLDLDVTVAPSSGDPDIDSVLCGTEEWITVPAGSDVVFCYAVTNSGEVRLDRHDLADEASGPILDDFAFSLEPGGSVFLTQTVPVATNVVNDALWVARDSVDPVLSAAASDAAVVTIPEPGPAATSGASGLALALLASHGRRARRAARGGCRRAG
ncbi:MAG: hypothetical protein QNK03_02815 [Myxococcota bacterium]|nr:hypothetical protein [Myxococcota bacterium]